MKPLLLICAFSATLSADEKPNLVVLYRFYDKTSQEYVYGYDQAEIEQWRKLPDRYTNETSLGYASTKPEQGTARLWRATNKKGRMICYLSLSKYVENPTIHDFEVYVWLRKRTGRTAFHATSQFDMVNPFFSSDFEETSRVSNEITNSSGKRSILVKNAFYLIDLK